MPATTLSRGNILNTFVIYPSLTPAQVDANVTAEQTFTIGGIQTNDKIGSIQFNGAYTVNVEIVNARVTAANTVVIAFQNPTGSGVTPPSGRYLIEIQRLEIAQYSDLPASAA